VPVGTGANVVNEDKTCHGDNIAGGLMALPADRIDSHRPIDDVRRNGQLVITVLTNEAAGNGNLTKVLRDWHFKTPANRVMSVRIERRPIPLLPEIVAAYVRATNGFDLDDLLATFVDDDALLNDQLKVLLPFWDEFGPIAAPAIWSVPIF